jgi:hypothetical protein
MPAVAPAPTQTVDVPFVPEPVSIGQVVLWSGGHGEGPASPAIVLKVGTGGVLTVSLHVDGVKDHKFPSGVRHVNDPWLRKTPEHTAGVWRLSDRDRRINALLESLGGDEA